MFFVNVENVIDGGDQKLSVSFQDRGENKDCDGSFVIENRVAFELQIPNATFVCAKYNRFSFSACRLHPSFPPAARIL
jgi:hypothetical protein